MMAIGLDIGGANLKVSDGTMSLSVPFPLWRMLDRLGEAIIRTTQSFAPGAPWAVTMTGELADCFQTRAEGVERILDAVEQSAAGRPVAVWQTSGEFVPVDTAREFPELTAAANWHALATWAGRMTPQGTSLLIDIGSTTTDIIPLEDGLPLPVGRTDLDRLVSSELLYLGVRRTPVCAIASEVSLHDRRVPLARELFATTLDVGLLTQSIAARPDDRETANDAPATVDAAWDRLARMLCSDRDVVTLDDVRTIAAELRSRMVSLVAERVETVLSRWETVPQGILFSGEGEWLATAACRSLLPDEVPRVSLRKVWGEAHSDAACAWALSQLLSERIRSA